MGDVFQPTLPESLIATATTSKLSCECLGKFPSMDVGIRTYYDHTRRIRDKNRSASQLILVHLMFEPVSKGPQCWSLIHVDALRNDALATWQLHSTV